MYRRSCSSERSSIRWPSFAVPRVRSVMICVWPRVKSAEPCLRGLGQRAQVVFELRGHRAGDCLVAQPLEDDVEARAHLRLARDVVLGRLHRERRAELGGDLLDRGGRLAEALGGDSLADAVAVLSLELVRELGVQPLRPADLAAQVLLRLAELLDLAVGEL